MDLKCITATGADDKTDVQELFRLSKVYSNDSCGDSYTPTFVEWGVLISPTKSGIPRYPTVEWIQNLCRAKAEYENNYHESFSPWRKCTIHLSLHLCGDFTKDMCNGNPSFVDYIGEDCYRCFDRLQINGIKPGVDIAKFYLSAEKLNKIRPYPDENKYIFQANDHNICSYIDLWQHGEYINIHPLFDSSGGRGVLPTKWKRTLNGYSGYAGGIGPENIINILCNELPSFCSDSCWIDAETKLRSEDDKIFDLTRVEAYVWFAMMFSAGVDYGYFKIEEEMTLPSGRVYQYQK